MSNGYLECEHFEVTRDDFSLVAISLKVARPVSRPHMKVKVLPRIVVRVHRERRNLLIIPQGGTLEPVVYNNQVAYEFKPWGSKD